MHINLEFKEPPAFFASQSKAIEMFVLELRNAGHNLALDATVVLPPEDLEGAMVAPVVVPRVGDEPVGDARLLSPTQDPDRVPAKRLPDHVLVDAGLVVGEVLVDGEGRLHRAVGHQLQLDLVHVGLDRVDLPPVGLVLLVGHLELGVLAGMVTLGGADSLLARSSRPVDVVLAGLDLIGLAALVGAVLAPADQALVQPVVPGGARETSVATEATGTATGEQVLAGHVHLRRKVMVMTILMILIVLFTCFFPLEWMQIRSEIAVTAPKAQHDPQPP